MVLLPGWPQTAEAYDEMAPMLAEHHELLILDPPGLGDSAPAEAGYDTANVSRVLAEAVESRIDGPYHLVGHDIGAWIAYAWAAQFPHRLKSLTVLDSAVPGCAPPRTFPLPPELNTKLWQFSFNALPELPEILTKGRERELFNWLFAKKAHFPERISSAHRERFVDCYSKPGAMSSGFAYYRAVAESAAQNAVFRQHKLPMPVLAFGGASGVGDSLRQMMETLALEVAGGVIPDCGHYVMEEQPELVARELLQFFERVDRSA